MANIPLRSLTVSDFRRIEGTRVLPLDAPVVLIHGPNGTGKTSILSALEFGLTGEVRSMERQDERYLAHLPFLGQPYATVRAEIAEEFRAGSPAMPLTVSGARVEGVPAFSSAAAKFYSERCYLDQASLGRLLELYQHREGKEESALAIFVNELLGLEKLDALRTGLHDATDLRLLKKRAVGVENASTRARAAAGDVKEHSATLTEARADLTTARDALIEAISVLHPGAGEGMDDHELLRFSRRAIEDDTVTPEARKAISINQGLIALGGRISVLSESPSMQRIEDARALLEAATSRGKQWLTTEGAAIQAWDEAAQLVGATFPGQPRETVRETEIRVRAELDADAALKVQITSIEQQLRADRATLDSLQARLTDARDTSSALVESLAALRTVVEDDICPVCDRDYRETGHPSLAIHIDTKLRDLAAHGQLLVDLRNERDNVAARVDRVELEISQLRVRALERTRRDDLENRHKSLSKLADELDALQVAIAEGVRLEQEQRSAQATLDDLEAASTEAQRVRADLSRYAVELDESVPVSVESLQMAWEDLSERAAANASRLDRAANSFALVRLEIERFSSAINREARTVGLVADSVQVQALWDARVKESKRRQAVANEVHNAATRARTEVVQRVFTESLNEVWKSVFTRLAPNEGFIPSFGIPISTKTALDIKLETIHRTGEVGGPPQMMLSAGNLNTAALSLFLALHLAVEPIVPCLVFDDPVQAMDEVHVAQFAAMIRLLAKQHQRQVVIAVHERELFEYLALELSPAYDGDELITIELGERANDADEGVTRHAWVRDLAIAG